MVSCRDVKKYKLISFSHDATDLEAVEVCVEDVSALDVGHQSHGQLLVGLISDVHHDGDVY